MRISSIELYRLRIPFRFAFAHHQASRRHTDNLVTKITLENGICGYGEGVPREYVTGETFDDALAAAGQAYLPVLARADVLDFSQAVSLAEQLPWHRQGNRLFQAARCSLELALLDAYGKCFGRSLGAVKGLVSGLSFQGDSMKIPMSAILPLGSQAAAQAGFAFFYRILRLRDFKLKWGKLEDEKRFRFLARLAKKVEKGRISLRLDANGAWSIGELLGMLPRFAMLGVESIEQPFGADDRDAFAELMRQEPPFKVTADESVRTVAEAEYLAQNRLCHRVNIRISKMGGFIPALRLVQAALDNGLEYQLGSMVGESGILGAAFAHFLAVVPGIRFAEPGYRRLLLKSDVVAGLNCHAPGLGIAVNPKRWTRYASLVQRLEAG